MIQAPYAPMYQFIDMLQYRMMIPIKKIQGRGFDSPWLVSVPYHYAT